MNVKQTVLVIEDSPLTVKILKNILKKEYEVLSAFSGEAGYELATTKKPDIIILDVVMSGMDGYEVCRKLKENDLTKAIPVIFISALGEMEDEWKGLETGAIDYITKPFSEPIVKIRIKNHLELKKHRDLLSELSSLDGLTGIYNRRYFDKTTELEWNKAIFNKIPFSLILLDIDKFKIYNDSYGHLEGDECLILVSSCLKSCIGKDDGIVARYGGEEFVCLLPNTDFEQATHIGERIHQSILDLKIPFNFSPISNVVTVSGGVGTVYPNESIIMTDFIKKVDDLLFIAKRSGRNNIKFLNLN